MVYTLGMEPSSSSPLAHTAARAGTLRRNRSAAVRRQQQQLAAVSARVKSHEKTHLAVLGGAAGSGISYNYVIGPEGGRYAVGGSIKVDLQPVPGNPEETLRKARQIRRAALAVGDPSGADMRVAAKAYRMEQQARQELAEERRAEREESRLERKRSESPGVRATAPHSVDVAQRYNRPEAAPRTGQMVNMLV